jgi:hypothetical protein
MDLVARIGWVRYGLLLILTTFTMLLVYFFAYYPIFYHPCPTTPLTFLPAYPTNTQQQPHYPTPIPQPHPNISQPKPSHISPPSSFPSPFPEPAHILQTSDMPYHTEHTPLIVYLFIWRCLQNISSMKLG